MAGDSSNNDDEFEQRLSRAVANGLKQYQSEREEEEAKRKAAEGKDSGGSNGDGSNGDSTGHRKSLAEWLLG